MPAMACEWDRDGMLAARLPIEQVGKYQWGHNAGIGFDDELWGIDPQFTPGYFFIWDGTRV
jgi:hypothetical protein